MKYKFRSLLIFAIILMMASSAYADNPGSKLLRGLTNTAFGFLELPINIYRISVKEGYPTGLTYGVGKGLVDGVYRTLVGIYEAVTFVIPVPADYKSILTPDTLLTPETLHKTDPAMRPDFRLLSDQLEGSSE